MLIKKDIKKLVVGAGALALTVGVTWLFSSMLVSTNSQQARVTSYQKYFTSDEVLKTLMTSKSTVTDNRDRDFATACATGTIKCGKVIIVKDAFPNSELDFTFYSNIPSYPSFMLDDDGISGNPLSTTQGMYTSPNGSYLVAEMPSLTDPLEYETFLSCADPSGNSVVLSGMIAAVIVNVNAGETVTCTFRNMMTEEVSSCASDTWTQKFNVGGDPRHDAVGFSIGNKGYVGTGSDGGSVAAQDFWEYDPVTNIWTQKANFGGGVRKDATGFSIGNKGYIGTGHFGIGEQSDFWEYDPATDTWTQKANFGGGVRRDAVGFSIDGKGYLGTGYKEYGPYYQDFWEYDPATDTWDQKADFPGGVRFDAVGFSIGSKGYIGTGDDTATIGGQEYQDFWEYDPATDTWDQKADFPGGVRASGVGFSIGSRGYLGTGITSMSGTVSYQDFWEYDPATDTWDQKADFDGGNRYMGVGFFIGDKGYIGTGRYPSHNDFWEYCP